MAPPGPRPRGLGRTRPGRLRRARARRRGPPATEDGSDRRPPAGPRPGSSPGRLRLDHRGDGLGHFGGSFPGRSDGADGPAGGRLGPPPGSPRRSAATSLATGRVQDQDLGRGDDRDGQEHPPQPEEGAPISRPSITVTGCSRTVRPIMFGLMMWLSSCCTMSSATADPSASGHPGSRLSRPPLSSVVRAMMTATAPR